MDVLFHMQHTDQSVRFLGINVFYFVWLKILLYLMKILQCHMINNTLLFYFACQPKVHLVKDAEQDLSTDDDFDCKTWTNEGSHLCITGASCPQRPLLLMKWVSKRVFQNRICLILLNILISTHFTFYCTWKR